MVSITKLFPVEGVPVTVSSEMCDYNGHMNVADYLTIFDDILEHDFYADMGFTKAYFEQGYSSFIVEVNIRYLNEVRVDEIVCAHYRLFDVSSKLIHFGGVLLAQDDSIAAIFQNVALHIDMRRRKSVEMSLKMIERLEALRNNHDSQGVLPFPLKLSIHAK